MTRAEALSWLTAATVAAWRVGCSSAAHTAALSISDVRLCEDVGFTAAAARHFNKRGAHMRTEARRVAGALPPPHLRARLTVAAILCALEGA